MKQSCIYPKSIFLISLFALVMASGATAQTTVPATASWSPHTQGTPVEYYVLQHSVNGGEWETVDTTANTSYMLTITAIDSHRVRVAGVDAQDRMGPFSRPSYAYTPAETTTEPPGVPGAPIRIH